VKKKKLLLLAPYPIINPQHGGQKRTKALYDFYKKHFSSVRFVGIYHRGFYRDHGRDDILLGQPDVIAEIDKSPQKSELIVGKSLDIDIHVRSNVAKLLMEYSPDIIHVEQVYLYAGLRILLRELNMNPQVIFGSQNIEYKMKTSILHDVKLAKADKMRIIQETQRLEECFSNEADLVIAVSEQDAQEHKAMGAKNVVIAPNGIEKALPTKHARKYWEQYKKDQDISRLVLFVGSGHPPNWKGYLDMVGDDSSFLQDGSRILLAGGISEYFKITYKYEDRSSKSRKFWKNVEPLGFLSEDSLAGLLMLCDAIILPITSGGGSNLKTAEAILSSKKIVATEYAFRGYEKYMHFPNITIVNTSDAFKDAINASLVTSSSALTEKQTKQINKVEWTYSLAPIKNAVNTMVKKRAAKDILKHTKIHRVYRRLISARQR
jgi:Glycosyltransferase Family 4